MGVLSYLISSKGSARSGAKCLFYLVMGCRRLHSAGQTCFRAIAIACQRVISACKLTQKSASVYIYWLKNEKTDGRYAAFLPISLLGHNDSVTENLCKLSLYGAHFHVFLHDFACFLRVLHQIRLPDLLKQSVDMAFYYGVFEVVK